METKQDHSGDERDVRILLWNIKRQKIPFPFARGDRCALLQHLYAPL
ncbi:hypothetical protein [Exiguobacterium sp. RIT452]|nr:hypothetical protein [Exiguobacterium sp. RIT452]